ncbi:MAG: hemerythrin domain-containing protein [Arenicella sp.]
MFSLFKKTKKVTDVKTLTNSYGLRYDPTLIDGFKNDHKHLLFLHQAMVDSSKKGDFKTFHLTLKRFTRVLRGHLLKENRYLYTYLEPSLESDPDSGKIVAGYKREMQGIGSQVNDFIAKYSKIRLSSEEKSTLQRELEPIGYVLSERIENEEEVLYPLYMSEG